MWDINNHDDKFYITVNNLSTSLNDRAVDIDITKSKIEIRFVGENLTIALEVVENQLYISKETPNTPSKEILYKENKGEN